MIDKTSAKSLFYVLIPTYYSELVFYINRFYVLPFVVILVCTFFLVIMVMHIIFVHNCVLHVSFVQLIFVWFFLFIWIYVCFFVNFFVRFSFAKLENFSELFIVKPADIRWIWKLFALLFFRDVDCSITSSDIRNQWEK